MRERESDSMAKRRSLAKQVGSISDVKIHVNLGSPRKIKCKKIKL